MPGRHCTLAYLLPLAVLGTACRLAALPASTHEAHVTRQSEAVTTPLFNTSDYGRGCGADWLNHGGADDCNRHILFLAVGPEIPAGQVETQRRTLIDIAPTIATLLRFDTPLAAGEVMRELFDD